MDVGERTLRLDILTWAIYRGTSPERVNSFSFAFEIKLPLAQPAGLSPAIHKCINKNYN